MEGLKCQAEESVIFYPRLDLIQDLAIDWEREVCKMQSSFQTWAAWRLAVPSVEVRIFGGS